MIERILCRCRNPVTQRPFVKIFRSLVTLVMVLGESGAFAQVPPCSDSVQSFEAFDYIADGLTVSSNVLRMYCFDQDCTQYTYYLSCETTGCATGFIAPSYDGVYEIYGVTTSQCCISCGGYGTVSYSGTLVVHRPLRLDIMFGEKTTGDVSVETIQATGFDCSDSWWGGQVCSPYYLLGPGSYRISGGGSPGPGLYLPRVTVTPREPATIRVPGDFASIQQAVVQATAGDIILVDEGSWSESLELLGKSITIKATGSRANTILDGTGLSGPVVRATSGETSATLLQGFTIRNGTSGTLVDGRRVGGGMLVQNASPTIRDCAFVSNSADEGGGLAAINSHSLIDGCTFSTNTAGSGGGLWLDGGRPTVSGCVVTGNSASGHGGGLYATPMPGQLPNVVLSGNTLCSNTSADAGRENLWALFDDGGNAICDCFGDVDGNGVSDTADISLTLLFFGSETDPEFIQPDQDMNGTVDTGDVALLLLSFGPCG